MCQLLYTAIDNIIPVGGYEMGIVYGDFTVIAVYIRFHGVTKNILYRFKVTGSLCFASNLQYPPSHPLEALYYAFCEIMSGLVLFRTRCWFDTNVM